MSYHPSQGFPRVLPRLRYEDVSSAITWLTEAFGFKEYLRWADKTRIVQHAEICMGEVFVELSAAHDEYDSPKRLGKRSQSLIMLVDDVDDHYAKARAAGADIVTEPEDMAWGLRQYTVDDLSGHRWEFAQYVRDVPAAEWGAVVAAAKPDGSGE
jgi:uncharacterized glyoxalase superfamily protein PhnB